MTTYKLTFFLIILFIINFCSANELLTKENINNNLQEIKNNFSFDKQINLELKKIHIGAAEAKKLPFSNYKITLDIGDLQNISEIELTGLLAHELAHLKSYENKNSFEMFIVGIKYVFSNNFKKEIERQADLDAIAYGFSKQILAFRLYRLNTTKEKDKDFIEEYYLSPEEIFAFNNSN